MQNIDGNNVFRISDFQYIDDITELHIKAFSRVLSGQIGKSFLKNYYKSIIKKGYIFGVVYNGQLSGFVSGITDESSLSDLKYYFWALYGIMTHLFSFSVLKSLLRHLRRIRVFGDVRIKPELLSIVIREDMRGKGFGMALVKALENHFREVNINSYKVFTDTKYSTGYKLYEKTGFQLYKEVDLYGLPFRMYVKNLN